jgi:hypothetical protein
VARLLYGGTPADFAVALGSSVQIPDVIPEATGRTALIPEGAVVFNVYDSVDGNQVTDLLDESGSPISTVSTSTELGDLGRVPAFYGPDNYTADLWLTTDSTVYYRIPPSTTDLFTRLATAEANLDALTQQMLPRALETAGASVPNITTAQVIATLAFNQKAGKRYRVTAMPNGSASTIGTLIRLHVREDNISGAVVRGAITEFEAVTTSSQTALLIREYLATQTGPKTLVVVAEAQGGQYTTFSSQSWYTVDPVP